MNAEQIKDRTIKTESDQEEPVIPRLAPEPVWCEGIEKPVICLDGEWEVKDYQDGSIRSVSVPFDMAVLRKSGFSRHYEYRKEIELPPMPRGSRIVLKFEGVNGFADLYVDDVYIASHQNGFLTWNAEITEQAAGKEKAELRLIMDEESDQVSAYSHGGILRSVWMYILPEAYVNAAYLTPLFDEDMETCTLRVDLDISGKEEVQSPEITTEMKSAESLYKIKLLLKSPDGYEAVSRTESLRARGDGYDTINLDVPEPQLWDAEHPRMYTLEMTLLEEGREIECIRRKTGLRKLTKKGNRLFVNHREVKLRGACRHEISPRAGRALTRELIEQDVALFKEANCNYIRTSHYPPSEYFLELCDENGIYVEDELALAFIARTLPYTQRDPEQTGRYLSHFTEVLARDYNHPSVIIWSLCNESFGGSNFDLLNRYVHRKDPTRLTKFSYPMTIREEHEMPDIWSIHYSEYDTDLAKKRDNVSVGHAPGRDLPVLHDEYAHVPCYNREELRRDPFVRSFWGEGLRLFWDNIWNTEGALGGAIWAGIDETDIYDGGNTQLEWGIIDVWRRKKPEFFMTRKAYSPVKILHCERNTRENRFVLVVENRFCHTDLSSVRLEWKCGDCRGGCFLPPAGPAKAVKAVICPDNGRLAEDEPIWMAFLDADGIQVDERMLPAERQEGLLPDSAEEQEELYSEPAAGRTNRVNTGIEIQCREQETILKGKGFTMAFRNDTGLLAGLWADTEKEGKKRLLTGGPILNAPYLKLGEWYLLSRSVEETPEGAVILLHGGYRETLEMTWRIEVRPDGSFITSYTLLQLFKKLPKQLKLRVGVDCGGLDELGITYLADPSMDTLSWRTSPGVRQEDDYAWYPEEHISRHTGTAHRFSKGSVWGIKPDIPWSQDMKNDILNGFYDVEYKGTNDFRSTKANVAEAWLYGSGDSAAIGVVSEETQSGCRTGESRGITGCGRNGKNGNGSIHIRLEPLDPPEWIITNRDERIRYTGTWYPAEDKKESYNGTEMWSREKGAAAECTFTGTGIVWYGPQDTTYGMADVYIDGKRIAHKCSQRAGGVDFSCSCAGYDKKYHIPIFSITDLPDQEHTIRIEVCGEKAEDASDCYIVLDYLRVLTGERTEPVKFMINQAFSFPHLSWGNYRKPPILPEAGTGGTVRMKIVDRKGNSVEEAVDRVIKKGELFPDFKEKIND